VSIFAIVVVFILFGYLARVPDRRSYSLGASVIALGAAAIGANDVVRAVQAELELLADELGMALVATAMAGHDIVALCAAGRPQPHGQSLTVGQRIPLVPPLGSVFLAWQTEEAVDAWLARAVGATATELDNHRAVLAAVRERGYSVGLDVEARRALGAVVADSGATDSSRTEALLAELGHGAYQLADLDEGSSYEISMIAAPVFDRFGRVELAMTVVGFPGPVSAGELERIGERLRDAGRVVTKGARGQFPGT
ncbi:MAG: hypothetical protein KDB21_19790, partial [Acidimicrobiales bacterium]|nr:hypothetical protein [Acidimicrobiales bacterium]